MHTSLSRKFLFPAAILSLCLATAACGRAGDNVEKLTDDPMSEPLNPGTENPADDGSKDLMETPVTDGGSVTETDGVLAKYDHLDPKKLVPDGLLRKAVAYYDANLSKIANKKYLSVIDFSLRSTVARFFIIDMKSGEVWAIRVAHGKGSDPGHDGFAESFSNVSGSNKSSVGIYRAAESYSGSHGLSLRLDGLSSTNSNARSRAIVIHGADYVQEKSVIQGRSWGCPAVSMENRTKVVNSLKGGSIIYAGRSGVGY